MLKYKIIYIFISLLLISCNKTTNKCFVNIEEQLQKGKICKLSEFADSVSYILLETRDECLLPANSSILFVDEQDVFIRGGSYIYRFSSKGFFKNKIGSVGGGPEEYYQLIDVAFDTDGKNIWALTQSSNLCLYNYEGKFLKKISLNGDARSIIYIKENMFACIINEYKNQYMSYLVFYNYNGSELNKLLIEHDSDDFERSLESVPITYSMDNILRMKSIHNDTIFQYTNNILLPYTVLSLGKFSPNRELIENVDKKGDLLMNYLQIVAMSESKKYFFLLAIYKQDIHGLILDKLTNKLIFNSKINSPKNGGGIENDLTNKGQFWPMLCHDEILVELVNPSNIQMDDIDDNSNPIIQIVHLKH